jgi:hypothetical protein
MLHRVRLRTRLREPASSRAVRRASALFALLAACAHVEAADPAHGLRFDGPGRLLVVFEVAGERQLVLLETGRARRLDVPRFREARFAGAGRIALALELPRGGDSESPEGDDYGPPRTQLALHDLATGATLRFGAAGRHYDLEPSPDGRTLAIGSERSEVGDADLEIWSLTETPERVAVRAQSLEEPRWRHDGFALAVALVMQDPESDDDAGGAFAGQSFSWPRLHRLRLDLGAPELVFDGAAPGKLAPGGTLPLWWDARGLFARQRDGLVRCAAAEGGCALVYAPEAGRRIVDGRPVGASEAWLLTVEARDAFDRREPDEILRVDVARGALLGRWRASEGVAILDLDWIDAGEPAPAADPGS